MMALLLGLASPWVKSSPKVLSFSAAKSHYILEVIKHVYWPEEKNIRQFNVGVIGGSKEIIDAFNAYYPNIKIRNIPLSVNAINKNKPTAFYHLIYVHSNKLSSIVSINSQYPEALVITDGLVSKSQRLLNIISSFDDIQIKLNLDNLHARNFVVSNNLLFFAGNKKDLEKQLKVKDSLLNDMYSDINKQSEALNVQEKYLSVQEKTLNEQEIQLRKAKADLANMMEEKAIVIEAIKASEVKLALQEDIIQKRYEEEAALKDIILKQQQKIESNQKKLLRQEQKINRQKTQISQQMSVISNQKSLLYLSVAVIVFIVLLTFFLWYLNILRRRSNRKLRSLNKQLYEIATTDSMTGLFTRRHFIEGAQRKIIELARTKKTCAVLMIDIDFFKRVNDTHGHAMGDKAIIAVAEVFKENMRPYDLLGRLGGEEYGLFLNDCGLDKAMEIANRVREKTFTTPICFQQITIHLSISIGITMVTEADNDINRILQRADKALYKAKNLGRNRVELFDEEAS